jgi:hypothetical protein
MVDILPLIPYDQRKQKTEGTCGRCGTQGVRVIESIEGGFICWNLGFCTSQRRLPPARLWDRSMAEIF